MALDYIELTPNITGDQVQVNVNEVGFQSWNDILLSDTDTGSTLLDRFLTSEANKDAARLNIEYTDYSNFVHYSSAAERLLNFRYKLGLIEMFQANIVLLSAKVDTRNIAGLGIYYTFDNVTDESNVPDLSGTNNTGTATGITVTSGVVNSAVSLARVPASSVAFATPIIIPTNGSFGVNIWVYFTSLPTEPSSLLAHDTSDTLGQIALVDSDTILLNGSSLVQLAVPLTRYAWNQLTVTRNASSLSVYVNGIISANATYPSPFRFDKIGHPSNSVSSVPFVGSVDEFRFFSRALVQSDASLLHADPSGNASGDIFLLTKIREEERRIRAIVNGFDPYERYLYSGTDGKTFTSEFGPNVPAHWPKNNGVLLSTQSTAADVWFDTQYDIAMSYDEYNRDSLRNLVPEHIREDDANQEFVLFVDMVAQYFDTIWIYITQITETSDRQFSIHKGMSRDLIWHVTRSLGFDLIHGNDMSELWDYAFGLNNTSKFSLSHEDITHEVWKRILVNIPYILKTKGTPRAIRALITCYGIPSDVLRIREYGTPPKSADHTPKHIFETYTNSLVLNGSQEIQFQWHTDAASGRVPDAIECRFALPLVTNGNIYTSPTFRLKMNPSSGSNGRMSFDTSGFSLTSSELPLFTGQMINVVVERTNLTGNTALPQIYRMHIRLTDNGRITHKETVTSNVLTGSANTGWNENGLFTLGQFTGKLDSFRLWSAALSDSVMDNHALYPGAYNGVEKGAPFQNLLMKLDFEVPQDLGNNQIIPNEAPSSQYASTVDAVGFLTAPVYPHQFDRQLLEIYADVPRLGASRIATDNIYATETKPGYHTLSRTGSVEDVEGLVISNKVGVYFSTVDKVNDDIIKTFGNFDFEDTLGDPRDMFETDYPRLDEANGLFWKNRTVPDSRVYLSLIRYYDRSLFRQIRKLLPARVNGILGLLYEPHLLERHKYQYLHPHVEDQTKYADVDLKTLGTLHGANETMRATLDGSRTIALSCAPFTYTSFLVPDAPRAEGEYRTFRTVADATSTVSFVGQYQLFLSRNRRTPYTDGMENSGVIFETIKPLTSWDARSSYTYILGGGYAETHYKHTRDQGRAYNNLRYRGCRVDELMRDGERIVGKSTIDDQPVVQITEVNNHRLVVTAQTTNAGPRLEVQ